MKKEGSISKRMKLEHGKMLALLMNFMKGKKDSLEKLKDMQSRHAFAEEKAIMNLYRRKKDFAVLSEVLEQHKMIEGLLKALKDNNKLSGELNKLMKQHIKLEDSKFYPMLDKDLMPEEQEAMFEEFVFFYNQKRRF